MSHIIELLENTVLFMVYSATFQNPYTSPALGLASPAIDRWAGCGPVDAAGGLRAGGGAFFEAAGGGTGGAAAGGNDSGGTPNGMTGKEPLQSIPVLL